MRLPTLFAALAGFAFLGFALAASPSGEKPAVTVPLLPGEPSLEDLNRARAVLEQWEGADPQKAVRRMQVVYWTPADRDPQPEYRPRLTRVMKHIQNFYGTQMAAWGFPGRTIQLDLAPDGLLRIPVAKGTLKSAECSETDGSDGQAIRRDCLRVLQEAGIDGAKETLVIFCNLADWDPEKRTMGHHSPYYAAGSSTGGTAWQVDSPLLDSDLLAGKTQRLTDRQYGFITVGRYNSIFVGGVCHEIGHALGLPHCRECDAARQARGTALMGSGNRTYGEELRGEGKGSFLTLPHALKLAAHPQFSGSVKQMQTPATVTFSGWKFDSTPDGLKVEGKLQSNLPCHAVLAYGDPEGGGDYDAAIAAGIPHADGRFSLLLPLTGAKSKAAMLSFVGVCANGAATASVWSNQAFSVACHIDAAGHYDVTPALAAMQVKEHVAAAQAGTLKPEALAGLSETAREALRRLSLPDKAAGKPTPAAAPDAVRKMPLSDASPSKAATGYGGVHYDRTPGGEPLIGPAGPAPHGLWAHAQSTFTYDLGGKWHTFSGQCALLQTGSGPVLAEIHLDGRKAWESGLIKVGTLKPFTLDVKGATQLTLTIKGEKGIGSAHSAWLQPLLTR